MRIRILLIWENFQHRKERNAMENFLQEGSMLYDLIGVVYHFGERTNSGFLDTWTLN